MISDSFQLPGLVSLMGGFFSFIVPPVRSFLVNFLAIAAVSIKLVSELDATEEATSEYQPTRRLVEIAARQSIPLWLIPFTAMSDTAVLLKVISL